MAPQQRGEVSERLAARLRKAGEQLAAAKAERDAAVVAALRAGGSTRVVGELVGLTGTAVSKIGAAHGWPDQAELDRRQAVHDERHRWDHLLPPILRD